MTAFVSALAIGFSLVILAGWLLLLSVPLIAATSAVAGGSALALASLARRTREAAEELGEGILAIDGLADDELAQQVRSDVGRVLQLAPAGSRPQGCACVKPAGDGTFVGVMRLFNSRGHYLLRTTGDSISSVADRLTAQLRSFREFPAKVGVKRPRCGECDSTRCPIKLLSQRRAEASA